MVNLSALQDVGFFIDYRGHDRWKSRHLSDT